MSTTSTPAMPTSTPTPTSTATPIPTAIPTPTAPQTRKNFNHFFGGVYVEKVLCGPRSARFVVLPQVCGVVQPHSAVLRPGSPCKFVAGQHGAGERLDVAMGMDPVAVTEDVAGIYDTEASLYVLRFEMAGELTRSMSASEISQSKFWA